MAHEIFPWYGKIKEVVAPTEGAATFFLILIVVITLLVIWKGNAMTKGFWAVYLVSP